MALNLPGGPWEPIFDGMWGESHLAIYKNKDLQVLMTILLKKDNKVSKVYAVCFDPIYSKIDPSNIVKEFDKPTTLMVKQKEGQRKYYILVMSNPKAVEPKPDKIKDAVRKAYDEVINNSKIVRTIAKDRSFEVTELKFLPQEDQDLILDDPTLMFAHIPLGIGFGDLESGKGVLLGIDKLKNRVIITPQVLSRSKLFGDDEKALKKLTKVIVEGSVISGIITLVLDSEGEMKSLLHPQENTAQFGDFKIDYEPLGLPGKKLKLGDDLWVDLNYIPPDMIMNAIGIDKDAVKEIIKALQDNSQKFESIEDMIKFLESKEETFSTRRAIRVLKILNKIYPGAFRGEYNIEFLTKKWISEFGKCIILDISELDVSMGRLLSYQLINKLNEYYKDSQHSEKMDNLIVFYKQSKTLFPEIRETVLDMPSRGIGYLVVDSVEPGIETKTKFPIIDENEAAVDINGVARRFKIRPPFTKSD